MRYTRSLRRRALLRARRSSAIEGFIGTPAGAAFFRKDRRGSGLA